MKKTVLFLTLAIFAGACFAYVPTRASGQTESESARVPVIMYHEVKTYGAGKDVILPWEFESDLKYLKESGYTTVTMAELIDFADGGGSLPEKPVVLSFDDGYLNNYAYVLPLLKKYDAKIVFSIIGKNTDDFTRIPDANLDYSHVTWVQLTEMLDSGLVEVQNHTYNLHKLGKYAVGCARRYGEAYEAYEQRLTEDIGGLQREITEMTGRTPDTFVYPYGKYCDEMTPILKKLGFRASLTCDYGINEIMRGDPESLFCLRRICRAHGYGAERLLREVEKL